MKKLEINLIKLKKKKNTVDWENFYYKTNEHAFNFQNFPTISTFVRDIYNGKITEEADEDQSDLLVEILNFKKKQNQKFQRKTKKKICRYNLFEGRERVLNAFDIKIFPIKIEGTGFSDKVYNYSNLKILTPKQMLQRLTIALAQVKTGSTSESLLMKSDKSCIFCIKKKKLLKKYVKILWIQSIYNTKMSNIFMNSENSKISDPPDYYLTLQIK